MTRLLLVLLAVAAGPLPLVAQPAVTAEVATPGVAFVRPVGVVVAPGQNDRLYVLEQGDASQPSRVLTLVPGDAAPTVFLDVTDRAATANEAGLLGLAFHPDYAAGGRVFVHYTAPASGEGVFVTRISEFARSTTDPLRADPASERVVLEVPQPANNHNGGTIAFGPDGHLYVGLGDGGGAGDPFRNGQNPNTLLGTILRLDVDDVPAGQAYGIPTDNPFVGGGGRPEVWAYGLRNPYRFSVGPAGVWVGDVGQDKWEEVSRVEAGGNYGWNVVEGPACYPPGANCDLGAYRPPVVSYPHTAQGGRSVTGGFVFPETGGPLAGHYLYGDFVSGRLWGLPGAASATPGEPVVLLESVPDGEGGQRTLLISSIDKGNPTTADFLVTDYGGTVYRLTARSTDAEPDRPRAALAIALAGPNPSRGPTAVRVESAGPVRVAVVDVRGREVAVLWDGPAPPDRLAVGGSLAPGVYAVRAVSAGGAATLRLVRL